jgi:hypothetical protein
MNKFETSLLQTLSSIDESLKLIATGKLPVKQPAKQPAKKAKKAGNGKVPKAVGKAVKSVQASNG